MGTILDTIVAERRIAVREARQKRKVSELESRIREHGAPKSLAAEFLTIAQAREVPEEEPHRVIAEVKRASPSKGLIREDFEPRKIAEAYGAGGARAISVLTEEKHFQGSLDHLAQISRAVSLPLLRKDFFVDPYQVIEARAFGASAILVIVACTEPALAADLRGAAKELSLSVLAEVHTRAELDKVLEWEDGALLGINNRDLHTFKTSLQTTLDLIPHVPKSCRVIAESGLNERSDLDKLRKAGAGGFLIGESLMRAPDPGKKLAEIAGTQRKEP